MSKDGCGHGLRYADSCFDCVTALSRKLQTAETALAEAREDLEAVSRLIAALEQALAECTTKLAVGRVLAKLLKDPNDPRTA